MVDPSQLRAALLAARAGGREEEECLARDFLHPIAWHAVSALNLEDEWLVDECVQVALVSIWKTSREVDPERNPYAFLRRKAYWEAMKQAAREQRRQAKRVSLAALELTDARPGVGGPCGRAG